MRGCDQADDQAAADEADLDAALESDADSGADSGGEGSGSDGEEAHRPEPLGHRRRRGMRGAGADDHEYAVDEHVAAMEHDDETRAAKEEEDAAIYFHFDPMGMSEFEVKTLPEFVPHHVDTYVSIRNDILAKFRRRGVHKFLAIKHARVGFKVCLRVVSLLRPSHRQLMVVGACVQAFFLSAVDRIYDFLNQYGYINGGIVEAEPLPTPSIGGTVFF